MRELWGNERLLVAEKVMKEKFSCSINSGVITVWNNAVGTGYYYFVRKVEDDCTLLMKNEAGSLWLREKAGAYIVAFYAIFPLAKAKIVRMFFDSPPLEADLLEFDIPVSFAQRVIAETNLAIIARGIVGRGIYG